MEDLYFSLHTSVKGGPGIDAVARQIGSTYKSLAGKLNPEDELRIPRLDEFVRILMATQDTDPLDVLCGMFGGRFVSANQESAESIMAATLHAVSEGGDVFKAVEAALADGELSDAERINIKREIMESISALTVLKNTLDKISCIKAAD